MLTNRLKEKIQGEAYRIVIYQLLGIIIIALLGAFFCGVCALSIFAGGMAYWLPCFLFVWLVFRYVGAQQTTQFITAFFFGEMLKLIISGILFLVIVKYLPDSLLSTLIGFISAMISFWVVCMFHFSKQQVAKRQEVG